MQPNYEVVFAKCFTCSSIYVYSYVPFTADKNSVAGQIELILSSYLQILSLTDYNNEGNKRGSNRW
jgi:hypothetical protein